MERANLLTSVRNDIEFVVVTFYVHRSSYTHYSFSAYHRSSAADSLLAERGRVDSSHRMTDDLLGYVFDQAL
jgi:golgi SNAP receptor complex member 1